MSRPPFPWLFTYVEDPISGKNHPQGRTVYRPVVPVTLVGPEEENAATFLALVDSGCERCLAAPGIARQIGVEPDADLQVPMKVLLGQVGFFDQFTVTFSRSARQLAIEAAEEFDRRWQ